MGSIVIVDPNIHWNILDIAQTIVAMLRPSKTIADTVTVTVVARNYTKQGQLAELKEMKRAGKKKRRAIELNPR